MPEVALRLLASVDFDPGFAEEPGLLTLLEDALRVVNRDLAAGGYPHCRLLVRGDEPGLNGNAYVETWDGYTSNGQGVFPGCGADPVSALVAVADDAQEAVMESLSSSRRKVARVGLGPAASGSAGRGSTAEQ